MRGPFAGILGGVIVQRSTHILMRAGIAGLFAAMTTTAAMAQPYPSKPIELVVHTSAGSGGDVISRQMAEIVRNQKLLPHPFIVNNRVGGGGVIAYNYFKTKRGDPYTMLSVTSTLLAMAYRPDVAIGLENYTPLALYAIDPQAVMVPADSPYKTFKDLADALKKDPGAFTAATTSTTGTGRMVVHLMEKALGVKIKFVTFKGGGDAVMSVAGGHTQFTTENLSEGMGLVDAKKLRVIAITTDKRLPQVGDVPTLVESGFPTIVAGTMRGFVFPAGVPKEAVTVMEGALAKAHKTKEWKDFASRNLYQDIYLSGSDFTAFLAKRMEEYREFYDAIGLAKKP
jgi:putative tricarboxylic transport membrane protein